MTETTAFTRLRRRNPLIFLTVWMRTALDPRAGYILLPERSPLACFTLLTRTPLEVLKEGEALEKGDIGMSTTAEVIDGSGAVVYLF